MIKITDKSKCTGCYACNNICPVKCITMTPDEEGFWYPRVNEDKCINCELCVKVCPEINHFINSDSTSDPICLAAWNKDEIIRLNSSSGGIFSALSECIINEGGTVFGAAFNKELEVIHKYIDKIGDIEKLRGSKYVQSNIGDTYVRAKNQLDGGRKVFCTGTPCQIAGLYNFLGKDYPNLFTCDLVCHGVPSPKLFQLYIDYIKSKGNLKISNYFFRNKKVGWKKFNIQILSENKKSILQDIQKDPYMRSFLDNLNLRPSCYECLYTKRRRVADITLGDFWGVANKYPDLDDDKGTSLLLINTYKGEMFIKSIDTVIEKHGCELEHAVKGNPNLIKPSFLPLNRSSFFEDLKERGFEYVKKKYLSPRTKLDNLILLIKNGKILIALKNKLIKLLK